MSWSILRIPRTLKRFHHCSRPSSRILLKAVRVTKDPAHTCLIWNITPLSVTPWKNTGESSQEGGGGKAKLPRMNILNISGSFSCAEKLHIYKQSGVSSRGEKGGGKAENLPQLKVAPAGNPRGPPAAGMWHFHLLQRDHQELTPGPQVGGSAPSCPPGHSPGVSQRFWPRGAVKD